MTTTAKDPTHTSDWTGMALKADQLIDSAGVAVNTSDITAALGSTSGFLKMSRSTLAATGTNLATAAQITTGFTSVTAADDTVGVKLPATPVAGTVVVIKSTVSNKILKVYPDAAATINAIGSNGAISLASGPTVAIFIADSTTQWYTIPLLPS
jgi:hypothetical protein